MMPRAPYILLDDQLTHQQRFYTNPVDIITAETPDEVKSAFEKLTEFHEKGFHLAGYLSYELGLVLEPKLRQLLPPERATPLLQFGVFESLSNLPPTEYLYKADISELNLKPAWTEAQYRRRFEKVLNYIRAGDVYQINLTFPMTGKYDGEAHSLYAAYRHRQKGRYGGIVSLGNAPEIISLSPELFFRKEGDDMSMRPMKGTRPRSANAEIDETLRQEMRGDAKSQAENLMIVDLLRNDLSRISKPGSVKVPELFAMETYSTLHQMTSRVHSKLRYGVDIERIFKSLFPCGSVTGAPKIRAMEIIDELEDSPRGAYCGALGYIDPNGDSCFNVGIRTLTLSNSVVTYNVGGGLVLDSKPEDEYNECLLKAQVLTNHPALIIETLRWDPEQGFIRGARHKSRMQKTAIALGYPFKPSAYLDVLKSLETKNKKNTSQQRIRITLSQTGEFKLTHEDYVPVDKMNIIISEHRLSDTVQNTDHKTSRRHFYDGERERLKALKGADEVIFLNNENHICEGSFTSIFIRKDGKLFTPPLKAGLLPGILRAELIETGKAIERHISQDDLHTADKLYVGNSLRGLVAATLLPSGN